MAKIKVFKFSPDYSKEITDFMQSVNIVSEGLFISDGKFGFLYKEKGEVGIGKDELINAVSAELSKAQKQFILQEGLERAYTDMVVMFRNRLEDFEVDFKKATEKTEAYKKSPAIPEEMRDSIAKHRLAMDEAKKMFKNSTTKDEKDRYLSSHAEIEANLNLILKESEKLQADHDTEANRLKDKATKVEVKILELKGKIKENKDFAEKAVEDREHAEVFIKSSMQLIRDIQAGEIDAKTKILKF